MLTRNFYFSMFVGLTGGGATGAVSVDGTKDAYVLSFANISSSMKTAHTNIIANSSGATGVTFGTGTTPATPSDYTLESQITSGLNITNPSAAVVNITDDYLEYTATYGISATADTTISEIGLFVYNNGKSLMYDRTVLDTPIEIPKGQSKQVTYTVRINYPTA